MRSDMSSETIRSAFRRNQRALELRPSVGQGTARTRVTLRDDLTCEVEDGNWKFVADLSEKHGSKAAGPDPGVFGRAALGTCLVMGYRQWAAHLEIPVRGIEVEVQGDYDSRGGHGVGDAPPGYREVRYVVTIDSEASEGDIMRLVDIADRHSPWLDDFIRPLEVKREVRIQSHVD